MLIKQIFQRITVCIVLLLVSISLMAQPTPNILVPDSVWQISADYKGSSVKLHQYRGKPFLIYFWNKNCYACLASFSKIDSLAQVYAEVLPMVMLNFSDSKEEIKVFFEKRKHLKLPRVPQVFGSRTFYNALGVKGAGTWVWISSDGRFKAQTTTSELNAKNLREFSDNGVFTGKSYWRHSSHAFDSVMHTRMIYGTYLGRNDPSLILEDSYQMGTKNITCAGCSVEKLYARSQGDSRETLEYLRPGRTVILKDKAGGSTISEVGDKYNYQLVLPSNFENPYQAMREDLRRYFGYSQSIRARKVKCLVLRYSPTQKSISPTNGTPIYSLEFSTLKDTIVREKSVIRNSPFSRFTSQLNYLFETFNNISLIDQTGLKGNFDIELPVFDIDRVDWQDFEVALKPYGLILKEEMIELPTLVLE